ncbi:protein of unknown function (plasmid) [Caballeronia sp. S22]
MARREKSFTVNDIAGGVVNSFGLALTLAFWAAHDAREIELGSGRTQGHRFGRPTPEQACRAIG